MSATPGPWVFERGSVVSVNQDDCYIGGKRPVVCNVNMLEGQDDIIIGCGGNATDNGKMLAAALEMYEALKHARWFIQNGIEFGYVQLPDMAQDPAHETLPLINAAMASAEGRNA